MYLPLPNFLIIGAMKSGTSALSVYLRAHPQVFMVRTKEIHYFDRNPQKGIDWYRSHFANSTTARAVGEATPEYMYFQECAPRMARVVPHARLIMILRNPVDRAYSHYWHNRLRGREPLAFSQAIGAEIDRLAAGTLDARRLFSYLDRGRYMRQLEHILAYYPEEQLHVLLFEDLRDRTKQTFQAVCDFLTVDPSILPNNLGKPYNRAVYFHSPALRTYLKQSPLPKPIKRILERLNVRKNFSYPPLSPELRQHLNQTFEAGNRALADWLGRDLSMWQA